MPAHAAPARAGPRTPLPFEPSRSGSFSSAAAQELGGEQDEAVRGEEDRGGLGIPEQRAQRMLEQQAEQPGGDRADDEQPREPRVGVAGRDLPVAQAAPKAAEDAPPLRQEEEEEHQRSREVRGDQEGEEIRLLLVQVPAEQLREDDRVAEARDREQFGDALQQADHDRLEVADE